MTQEETLEYNKRCAEFLEYSNPISDKDFYFIERLNYNETSCIPKLLELNFENRFYSDWNWIMEVVEAIEKIFHIQGVEINGRWCCIKTNTFHEYRGESKKEAVVQAINQFLIWYNENK